VGIPMRTAVGRDVALAGFPAYTARNIDGEMTDAVRRTGGTYSMALEDHRGRRRVVVTGMGVISPVGQTTEGAWRAVIAGESGIGPITLFDTTGYDVKIAGEVKNFDAEGRLGRKEARRADRFCQFAIAAALDAVENSALNMDDEDPERVGVLVGSGIGGIGSLSAAVETLMTRGPSRVSPFLIPMLIIDMSSGLISMRLKAKGPNHSVVSACTTGAHAIGDAAEIIRRGDADVMVAGGSEASIVPVGIVGFANMKALTTWGGDPTRASRPFDADRSGFVCSEGAAVLVLESADHAVARGADILGELVGYGSAADAYDMVHPAPEGEGLARAMKLTLKDANLQPSDVGYINAHGTSTPLNDAHETMAIKHVFGDHAPPVSSTKSMTGHLLGAAGSLEAAFAICALRDNTLPPTINYETPDPECDLDYVPNTARCANISYALSSNSGFGGHNTGLIFGRFAE
jgi:3-oxoacyl-[acyl-carrier-protein] synthase II